MYLRKKQDIREGHNVLKEFHLNVVKYSDLSGRERVLLQTASRRMWSCHRYHLPSQRKKVLAGEQPITQRQTLGVASKPVNLRLKGGCHDIVGWFKPTYAQSYFVHFRGRKQYRNMI